MDALDMPVVRAFRTQIIFIVTQKSPTHFLSDCVLPHPPPTTIRRSRACFDLLWNNAIYGPLFTEVCLLYSRANRSRDADRARFHFAVSALCNCVT